MKKGQGMKGWVGAWSVMYQKMRVIQCLYHLSLPGFHQELQNEEGWCLRSGKWASSILPQVKGENNNKAAKKGQGSIKGRERTV